MFGVAGALLFPANVKKFLFDHACINNNDIVRYYNLHTIIIENAVKALTTIVQHAYNIVKRNR